jgi:NurA-like 5'-3' nuclease
MAKKLKVTQPVTIDGQNLAYDGDIKPLTTSSIVELGAKKEFEKFNEQLPEHLKYTFEVVDEDGVEAASNVDVAKITSELADKEAEVTKANEAVVAKDKAIADKEAEVAKANEQIANLTKQLDEAKKAAAKTVVK